MPRDRRPKESVPAQDFYRYSLHYFENSLNSPSPSPANGRDVVSPNAVIAGKAALYSAMREVKMSNVALAAKLGCVESDVRRMLDPGHATKIGRLEEALALFGRRMVITVEAA